MSLEQLHCFLYLISWQKNVIVTLRIPKTTQWNSFHSLFVDFSFKFAFHIFLHLKRQLKLSTPLPNLKQKNFLKEK